MNAIGRRKRVKEYKERALKLKGGKCETCGYNKCTAALDFHHVGKKEKYLGTMFRINSWERIEKELKKTKLLCSNCHRELHFKKHGLIV